MISFGQKAGALALKTVAVGLLLVLAACAQKEPKQKLRATEFAMAQRAASLEKVRPYGLYRQAGRNWEKLEMTTDELNAPGRRCIRQNNYWCVKTPPSERWRGQVGEDNSGHAIFADPVYSARAFARLMRNYRFKHEIITARQLAMRYAPPSDCIGTLSYCPVSSATSIPSNWTRGSMDGKTVAYTESEPSDAFFRAQTSACDTPVLYCPRGFNDSLTYASALSDAVGVQSVDQNIGLFDTAGLLHYGRAQALYQAMARYEMGASYAVDPTLIRRGMVMEAQDYLTDKGRLH